MLVKTRVPITVIKQLDQNQDVFAKTDWKNPYSPEAYRLLSKTSGLSNFFFGIKLTNDVSSSEILNILDSPNKPEHQYEITLDLDPSTIFAHDFYAFSGLILDCQEKRPQAEIQKNANRLHITQKNWPIQVIFPAIHQKDIVNIQKIS